MIGKFLKIPLLVILFPASFLWENIYKFRRFCYNYGIFKQKSFRVPIISVGNLTFGGTGKTPFTMWLAEYFISQRKKVMVLMRGYKGKLEDSSGILRTGRKLGYNPFDYGDEALLYAKRLTNTSIVVGKRRSDNLLKYFSQELPDVVLLDDGHQHLGLRRNLNILLFDATLPLERYKVAPLGYMREGFHALKDADLVVLGRVDQVSEDQRSNLKKMIQDHLEVKVPIAEITYMPTGLYSGVDKRMLSLEELKGMNVICVAGVASPESFFDLMKNLGAVVLETFVYPDHHYFTEENSVEVFSRATELDAIVVTTEKDMVKMKRITSDERLYYLEISIQFLTGEQKAKEIISAAFLSSH